MSTIVPLRKAIKAHGETLSALTLRRPTGKDIAACGNPRLFIRRDKMLVVEVDTAVIHSYISHLGNIPPSSVDTIDVSDWGDVQESVLDFFEPTAKPAPKAPGAGEEKALSDQTTGQTGKIQMPFQDITT